MPQPFYGGGIKIGLTFDLSPTDLNIDRGHLLIKDYYLPSLKLHGPNVLELLFTQVVGDQHDLGLWPTYLNITRDHLLIMDYLPYKFEASRAKHSWVISYTRCGRPTWPLTLTFNLLTWLSIGIIYSSRTIYLPSLKLLGQRILSYQLHKVRETNKIFDLDVWPTQQNINMDHLHIKDYLPTKFEVSGAKRCWIFSWTRSGRPTWPLTLNPSHSAMF